jgi:hypothetical protein
MFSKLLVFGAGYVLGTKAGRARYNQIAAIAQAAAQQLDLYAARNRVSPRDSWSGSRTAASYSARNRVSVEDSRSGSRTGASRSGYSRY